MKCWRAQTVCETNISLPANSKARFGTRHLITHGHRLISDDHIILKKIGESLIGSSPELTREHLEIRGLGIVNVRDLFGVSAIGKPQAVELVIEVSNGTKPSKSKGSDSTVTKSRFLT